MSLKAINTLFIGFIFIAPITMIGIHPRLKEYCYPANYEKIDSNTYFVRGGGSNSTVLISNDRKKIVVIDTKSIRSKELYKFVYSINRNAEIIIILTHYHSDHTKGLKYYKNAYTIAGNYSNADWKTHAGIPLPDERIEINQSKTIELDDETICIENMGAAHTRNDLVVFLKKKKILITGDLVYIGFHPVMNHKYGTDINHWIDRLRFIDRAYDYKTVIPGHGELSNRECIITMQNYLKDIQLAANDESRLKDIQTKYKSYLTVPFLIGLKRNLRFVKEENKQDEIE